MYTVMLGTLCTLSNFLRHVVSRYGVHLYQYTDDSHVYNNHVTVKNTAAVVQSFLVCVRDIDDWM